MRMVVFDLNGTLDTEKGLEYYKEQASRDDTIVGILTGNTIQSAEHFSEQHDIEPHFIRRGIFKAPRLNQIRIARVEDVIYVGNMITDEIAAKLAGWKFISVSEL